MAKVTVYTMQPYTLAAARWRQGKPEQFKSETGARRAAERLPPAVSGAVVFEQALEPEFEVWGEPRLLASYGEVPEVG